MRAFEVVSVLFGGLACASPLRKRATPASSTDFDELHAAAQLSSAAYSACQGQAFDVAIASQINDAATDTHGFIGYDATNNRVVTVFRGSTSATDIANDADTTPVTPSLSGVTFPAGAQVMRGIVDPYSAVHDQVVSTVKSLLTQNPTASLEVTGHSLGGSLTYLAHVAVAQNFPGTPLASNALAAFAVGNSAFADFAGAQANATLRRGNNAGDGVPNLYAQFTHYGTEFFGSGSAASTVQCDGELDPQCSAGDGLVGVTAGHFSNSGVAMGGVGCG